MRVLFVTTEMDDFVRVGGLGAVSAALPRALRPLADIRVMLPGYRDIIEQLTHIQIVGRCPALAEMPACSLGRAATKDGLPVYVLLCSQLYGPTRQSLWRRVRTRLAGQRHPLCALCLGSR
ncbi:glycogen synthase [Bradyrhizobium sp. i1.4.4]